MLPEKIYNDLKDVAHDTATEFQKNMVSQCIVALLMFL